MDLSGDEAIARAEAAASAAVREEHHATRAVRNGHGSAQPDSRAQGQLHLALAHLHVAPPWADSPPCLARSRSSRTSSSLVWLKSSYQRPTARNGSGVAAQTTSSASFSISAQTDGAAIGTATMIVLA